MKKKKKKSKNLSQKEEIEKRTYASKRYKNMPDVDREKKK